MTTPFSSIHSFQQTLIILYVGTNDIIVNVSIFMVLRSLYKIHSLISHTDEQKIRTLDECYK